MIRFDEENHRYTLDGKALISVTQLMKKHGLAPDYSAVSESVLAAKAERGTLIHKEIEEFNKDGEIGFTRECANYSDYVTSNEIECIGSEKIVHNDIVAGTIDLILKQKGEIVIADIKTTAKLHREAVSWQLSIYAILLAQSTGIWAEKAQAFHFDKDGNLDVVEIPFIPTDEVERLFECERKGEIYTQSLAISPSALMELEEVEEIIASAENAKKEAEARAAEIKEAIVRAMEENGIKTWKTDKLQITYVAPSERKSLDTATLKKEMPEIAEKYSKTSKIAPSIRVKIL